MIFKQSKIYEQQEFKDIVAHIEEIRTRLHELELKLASMPKNSNAEIEDRTLKLELQFKQMKDLVMAETPNKKPTLSSYGRLIRNRA